MNISAPDCIASVKVDLFNYYSSPIVTWNKENETWELSEEGMDFGYGNVCIDPLLGNAKDGYTVNFTYTIIETANRPYGESTELFIQFILAQQERPQAV